MNNQAKKGTKNTNLFLTPPSTSNTLINSSEPLFQS